MHTFVISSAYSVFIVSTYTRHISAYDVLWGHDL